MTPLVAEYHNAHKERLARFARAAVIEHKPVERKPEPVIVEASTEEPEASAKPAPWFSIVEVSEVVEPLSIESIRRATCRYFGITKLEFMSRRRTLKIMRPRQIAIYLCKVHTPRSLPEIGRHFGGFDHTTILHNARITEKRMREDWCLAFDIAHIEGMLA
jgi:hypothetical protein